MKSRHEVAGSSRGGMGWKRSRDLDDNPAPDTARRPDPGAHITSPVRRNAASLLPPVERRQTDAATPHVDDMSEHLSERRTRGAGGVALKFKVTPSDCDSSGQRRGNRREG
ncbi:hypothetical protein JOB18_041094 [Solea senegalensis]|uniref:Uncharacterized protein n=1 Tax=Solea senegalensis TaxID=28829 RepID=A0AAV6RH13_SOLSE|nr:hypothetical protein JOB18_041094 [Solea senegalensis]